jgi:hypothetical protein
MIELATLPARTKAFLERGAPEGRRQAEAFAAAAQLRDAGVVESEAVRLVQDGAARCGLPASEARSAVRSAYKRPARERSASAGLTALNRPPPETHSMKANVDTSTISAAAPGAASTCRPRQERGPGRGRLGQDIAS